MQDFIIILLLMISSVFLIVNRQRFMIEKQLRRRFGIDRDWWVPPLALLIGIALSAVDLTIIPQVFLEKIGIILLIFSFGLMALGIGKTGFFEHISYRIVKWCDGKTSKLILAVFGMTSAVTFFTTNDIVILALTPIIVTICFQAGIKNTRLMLLSQFVAANTLSMALMIGSPTNIIIAEQLNIDFFSYFFLMLLPSLTAFTSSLGLVFFLTRSNSKLLSGFSFEKNYSVPGENPEPVFTNHMRDWLLIFAAFIGLVAFTTYFEMSLIYASLFALTSSFLYWHFSVEHESIVQPLEKLPYGIFFFGMSFFIFAGQFAQTGFVNSSLVPFLNQLFSSGPVAASFGSLFGSGLLVNLFNDLPAAALVAQILPKLQLGSSLELLIVQASLTGLNIGTYVTHIGALAGLIWFNELRVEQVRESARFPELAKDIELPSRTDLVKYGLLHFLFTGTITATVLLTEFLILSVI